MNIEVGGVFGFFVLVLNVWAIVKVIQSKSSTAVKVGWIVAILVLPILGFIAWLLFGPKD